MENHFKTFAIGRHPRTGGLFRAVWVLGTMLILMAYQGNLKVFSQNVLKHTCPQFFFLPQASLAMVKYESIPETLLGMLEEGLPVYTSFEGTTTKHYTESAFEFDRKLYEHVTKMNSSLRL